MQRIDKWLWCARFAKSRTLAASLVSDGRVRVNGERCIKPAHNLKPGDVLSIAHGPAVRVVRMLAAAERRGPAPEAQRLYDDLTSPLGPTANAQRTAGMGLNPVSTITPQRPKGDGRPTKKDRRALDSLRFPSSLDE